MSEFIHRVETRELRSPGDYIVLASLGLVTLLVAVGLVALIIANFEAFVRLVLVLAGLAGGALVVGWICYRVGLHVDMPILKKLYDYEGWLEKHNP